MERLPSGGSTWSHTPRLQGDSRGGEGDTGFWGPGLTPPQGLHLVSLQVLGGPSSCRQPTPHTRTPVSKTQMRKLGHTTFAPLTWGSPMPGGRGGFCWGRLCSGARGPLNPPSASSLSLGSHVTLPSAHLSAHPYPRLPVSLGPR